MVVRDIELEDKTGIRHSFHIGILELDSLVRFVRFLLFLDAEPKYVIVKVELWHFMAFLAYLLIVPWNVGKWLLPYGYVPFFVGEALLAYASVQVFHYFSGGLPFGDQPRAE